MASHFYKCSWRYIHKNKKIIIILFNLKSLSLYKQFVLLTSEI